MNKETTPDAPGNWTTLLPPVGTPNRSMEWARQLEFEPVPECYVCGSPEAEPEFELSFFGHPFRWIRCRSCQLVYQSPKLTKKSLWLVYNSETYWMGGGRERDGVRLGYHNYASAGPYRLAQANRRVGTIEKYIPRDAEVLEIGCASGLFVKVLGEHGFRATGIELSEPMANYGRQQLGVDIQVGDFDALAPTQRNYDGIAAWGCDSNFHNLRYTFTAIRDLLRPGGIVAFNFFDFDHPGRLLLGRFKRVYNALYYLNRKNTRMLLESLGLEVMEMNTEWQSTCLDEIFSLTGRPTLKSLVRQLGIGDHMLNLPIIGSYLVIARKAQHS